MRTLLVDGPTAAHPDGIPLASIHVTLDGQRVTLAPEELWALPGAAILDRVVVSKPRPARELFRVLSLVERLVAPGGAIVIVPFAAPDGTPEVRWEATEAFLGVTEGWEREQVGGGDVELRRFDVAAFREKLSNEGPLKLGEVPAAIVEARATLARYESADAGRTFTPDDVYAATHATEASLTPEQRHTADAARAVVEVFEDDGRAGDAARVDGMSVLPCNVDHSRVVSLSIFGDCRFGAEFWRPLPGYLAAYVRAHHSLFPGWELRIHHDEAMFCSNYGAELHAMQARGLVRLVFLPSRPGQGKCERMMHRYAPAWDPRVNYVVARDVDGITTWRDRRAVEEWIASGLDAHTIHDSPSHSGMMGGLCAFKAEALRAIAPTFEAFVAMAGYSDAEWAVHGADQTFLNSKIAERLSIFEHSVFTAFAEDGVTRLVRKPSEWGSHGKRSARFETEIAAFDDAGVSVAAWDGSDALVAHMGAAGYDWRTAIKLYDAHCPAGAAIREAEREGGGAL